MVIIPVMSLSFIDKFQSTSKESLETWQKSILRSATLLTESQSDFSFVIELHKKFV
jgi:hypothetical protein